MKIYLNTTSTIKKVTEIELHIYFIKERARSCHHNLPFKHIPKVILVAMLMKCELRLNMFPQKGRVSTSVSTHTILIEVMLEFNKHCRLKNFQYSQVYQ